MAEKRMFSKSIIDSDAFLEMPLSSQALYFHLNMRADDDGFVNNPKKIQRSIGASEDDLKLLLLKRFVIGFESGIIVIKHWRMHNTLRKDRYNPTQYTEEFALLKIKENGAYTENVSTPMIGSGNHLATTWQPLGNHLATQYREDKNSIEEDSIVLLSSDDDALVFSADEIVDLFNKICVDLPKVKTLTDERKRNIASAAKVLENTTFEEYFRKVHASDFLCGRDGKWQADFNWVIKKSNVVKVLEGNYDNRETEKERKAREDREKMQAWLRGESI